MSKYATVLALAVMMMWAGSSYADVHKCDALGYQVNLPVGWQALDLQKMQTDPKLLETAVANADKGPWKTADKNLTGNVRQMLNSGKIEYFTNSQYPDSIISVNETQGKLPKTDAEIISVCESLPAELSKLAGKSIQVYNCQAGSVADSNALFIAADAYADGSKSFQYEVQKSPNEILVFTATCPDSSCEQVHKEMWGIISSVQFE
ncbi:MAG: hypothetical protein WCA08_13355 [Desulfoferrobacter sp.]